MSDSGYKALFSHPELVEHLLRGFVPGAWLDEVDFSSLELYGTELVSETREPESRHEDLVWRLRFSGQWVYLYLMLEFQSRPDRWMALRMLAYTALLWQKLVRSGELAPEDTLPPVLPVVLYNGERRWRAPSELTALCYPAPPGIERYQPQARYVLLDEKHLAAGAGGMQNLAAALFRLEFSADPADFRQVAAEAGEWFLNRPGFVGGVGV